MMNKPYIQDLISNCEVARLETLNNVGGVRFLDENEFIPWNDLGFNEEMGFYKISQFPHVENHSQYATWSIHSIIANDPNDDWEAYALLDSDGFGYLLGEKWHIAELLEVVKDFVKNGACDEPISEDDESLGTRWLTISEACQEAHNYDPEEYVLDKNLPYRIRKAARQGHIKGWTQDGSGRYKFQIRRFRHWLVTEKAHRPGPK